MAFPTYTAYAASSRVNPRYLVNKDVSISESYNSGTLVFTLSKTTVLMCRIPNQCVITNIVADHTSGAAQNPADYGISIGDLSTFASSNDTTKGPIVLKNGVLPYDVSTSDGAKVYITFTPITPTATGSVKCNLTVTYRCK